MIPKILSKSEADAISRQASMLPNVLSLCAM